MLSMVLLWVYKVKDCVHPILDELLVAKTILGHQGLGSTSCTCNDNGGRGGV